MIQKPPLQKRLNSSTFAVVSGVFPQSKVIMLYKKNNPEIIIVSQRGRKNKKSLWGEFRH